MKSDPFRRLLAFLERLDDAKIAYTLEHSRDDALMVLVYSPAGYWEVEFTADGEVDIERYRSDGRIEDESALEELFASWADEESPGAPKATDHEAAST
jgi:hypothetical protein